MCEQCIAETIDHGEVLPGIYLVEATAQGRKMNPGDWGLVFSNDPFMIWQSKPVSNKENMELRKDYVINFIANIKMDPEDGHILMKKAIESKKYDGEEYIGVWLAWQIADYLEKTFYFNHD